MNKSTFIKSIKEYKNRIDHLKTDCNSAPGNQVQRNELLIRLEDLASQWFEHYEPAMKWDFSIEEDILIKYRTLFGNLLELTDKRPSKNVVDTLLNDILDNFHKDLIVAVQMYQSYYQDQPIFADLLNVSEESEKDYLLEAIECARTNKPRAAIVLGWSAAVNRLHLHISHIGIDKLNQATIQMEAIKSGRYKRFNKKFNIQNLTDLRMSVFDRDLLWILEFIGSIDGNQHERLEICLTMRNTSAHPGEAPFSNENVTSFFSDLYSLVFANTNLPYQ